VNSNLPLAFRGKALGKFHLTLAKLLSSWPTHSLRRHRRSPGWVCSVVADMKDKALPALANATPGASKAASTAGLGRGGGGEDRLSCSPLQYKTRQVHMGGRHGALPYMLPANQKLFKTGSRIEWTTADSGGDHSSSSRKAHNELSLGFSRFVSVQKQEPSVV
jgi:hypothetical protein